MASDFIPQLLLVPLWEPPSVSFWWNQCPFCRPPTASFRPTRLVSAAILHWQQWQSARSHWFSSCVSSQAECTGHTSQHNLDVIHVLLFINVAVLAITSYHWNSLTLQAPATVGRWEINRLKYKIFDIKKKRGELLLVLQQILQFDIVEDTIVGWKIALFVIFLLFKSLF